jgi:hypothetical protein
VPVTASVPLAIATFVSATVPDPSRAVTVPAACNTADAEPTATVEVTRTGAGRVRPAAALGPSAAMAEAHTTAAMQPRLISSLPSDRTSQTNRRAESCARRIHLAAASCRVEHDQTLRTIQTVPHSGPPDTRLHRRSQPSQPHQTRGILTSRGATPPAAARSDPEAAIGTTLPERRRSRSHFAVVRLLLRPHRVR